MREEYEFGVVVAQGIILSAPSYLQNIPPCCLLNSPAHQELLSSAGINTSLHYHGNADNYLQVARESRGSTDISPEEQTLSFLLISINEMINPSFLFLETYVLMISLH